MKGERSLSANKRIVLRWSVWGNWDVGGLEMLGDSISSFRPYFPDATYVLSYAQNSVIQENKILPSYLQWHSLPIETGISSGDELWLKWFPQEITDQADLLIVIDADVFCVAEPRSLTQWIEHEGSKSICCMQESNPGPYGNFYNRLRIVPRVNSGFVATRDPAKLTRQIMAKYKQYRKWAVDLRRTWHDEQGALAEYWLEKEQAGAASYLSEARNKLLCPSINPTVTDLTGLEVIHTPYPDHPKYHELKVQIKAAIASAATPAPSV
jgi:hypothetical protein